MYFMIEVKVQKVKVSSSPVKSEEDIISLIMKRGNLPSNKLRIMGKERCKHPSNRMAQPCCKIIQNYFRYVLCGVFASSLQNHEKKKHVNWQNYHNF